MKTIKVRDIMTEPVVTCAPHTNLATASGLMWDHDCGVLPVVEGGHLRGIVTDRDICIALGTRGANACSLTVGDVATKEVETCPPEADVHAAMGIMRRARVRRLPVVDRDGMVRGIVALNDIILTVDRKHGPLAYEEVLNTVKSVSEHRHHATKTERVGALAVA